MSGRTPDTVYDQLDRIQAQLAHLQATMQRVLIALERLAGPEALGNTAPHQFTPKPPDARG